MPGDLTSSIGQAHGKSAAQVALKWILSHGVPVATKSNNLEHLKSNLDIFDFNLTSSELAQLDAARFGEDTPSFLCRDPEAQKMVEAAERSSQNTSRCLKTH